VEQAIGEVSVIREKQKPFGVIVEPSDWEEPRRAFGQQVHDDRPPARVLETRDIATRLVEEQVRRGVARADGAAVEADAIGRGICLRSWLETDHSVHRDATGGEEGLSPPS
jgi:hypothetical protein